ncbi:hypothetical protein F5888DRAFT_1904193 [Russula emetica]|nr:hypothetical protein F5888DRAFT_1904193 [Russula emetica]
MSSTLPLPPKPDFDPVPVRRQRSPHRSPPPRTHAVPLALTWTGEGETIIVAVTDVMTPAGIMNLIGGTEETMTGAIVLATTTLVATRATIFVIAAAIMKKGITTVDATNVITTTVDAIAHRVDVPGVGDGMIDHGHPVVVHPLEIAVGVPRRLHRVVAHREGVPKILLAPSEPKSPLQPDSEADVRRPQRDRSPSPASPQPPSSTETRPSRTSASPSPQDKGKGKVTPQSAANINEDVKMVDSASWHSPQPTDQPRKPSPQPLMGTSPTTHVPPHPSLPSNLKRSRTSQSQNNPSASNLSRSSSGFRFPPIPPHEVKEVVKESLNKEASRTPFWIKAAAEPLIRAAERSRHELEMGLLELYAAGERRKVAAAQVEEARAGMLGVGHE